MKIEGRPAFILAADLDAADAYETVAYERNERLYFTKERLQSWDGVVPYPGVVSPAEGMLPDDPTGKARKEAG